MRDKRIHQAFKNHMDWRDKFQKLVFVFRSKKHEIELTLVIVNLENLVCIRIEN